MAVLEAFGMAKRYGAKEALTGINLALEDGSVHGLIGPNGSGKTTLIGCIAGEIAPTKGRVKLRGRDITSMPAWRRARLGISRSFQVSQTFGTLTVEENIQVAGASRRRLVRSLMGRRWTSSVDELIDQVSLNKLRGHKAATLSQGDRKRLELAMCLASNASVILLDEPTAGMGAAEAADTAELLRRIHRTTGTAMLITEHNMKVMFGLADTITVLHEGSVLMSGDPSEVRTDPRLRDIYFGAAGE
jgi:branched-chain amino acid transport system ATP-binding protein